MKIFINNRETETVATRLSDLAAYLNLPEKGVAVAVNNVMIPRNQWEKTSLKEYAKVTIIKAACGG